MPLPQSMQPLGKAGQIHGITPVDARRKADETNVQVTENAAGWAAIGSHGVPPKSENRNWNSPTGLKAGIVNMPMPNEPIRGVDTTMKQPTTEPIIETVTPAVKTSNSVKIDNPKNQQRDLITAYIAGSQLRLEFDRVWFQPPVGILSGWLILLTDKAQSPNGPPWIPPRMTFGADGLPKMVSVLVEFKGMVYTCTHLNIELNLPIEKDKNYFVMALTAEPFKGDKA